METLLADLRFGFRQLVKRPGFTLLAIVSIALGIGANSAIFSLIDTVLLRPLPVYRPGDLAELYGTLHKGADITLQSYPNYKDYRDRNTVFSGLMAYRIVVAGMSHGGNNERVWGYVVSGNYFDVLGVKPVRGRAFLPEEDQAPGAHAVLVLSYSCWQHRFGGAPNAIGQTVLLNNHPFTIIGVAPKGFVGTEVAYAPEFFVPMMMARQLEPGSTWLDSRQNDNLFVVGRLKPGVTIAQATAALEADTNELAREYPHDNGGRGVRLLKPGLFIPDIRDSVFTITGVLSVVGALVLLLACVNLANLLLARATERRKELALRLALGAKRGRVVRQLITESVLLSSLGGLAGALVALWIIGSVRAIKLPTDIALVFDLRLDWRVLVFTLLLSGATGVVFSVLPALQSSKPELVPALKEESSMAGFRRSRLRNLLVIVQVALSFFLLISAGLIVRSLQTAQRMRPGFNPENAVALSFDTSLQGYDEDRGAALQRQILERARAVPGVHSAALTDSLPLSLNYSSSTIYIEGQPETSASDLPLAVPLRVSPDYFVTMGMPVRGRDFTPADAKADARVAIVNEAFARRFFPNSDAIGKRFNFSGPKDPLIEIVGVVPTGKYNSLAEDPKPAVFRPLRQNYNYEATVVARIQGDAKATIAALRDVIRKADPTMPIYNVKTLREHMNIPLFPAHIAAAALGGFGVLALVLAAVGIYGVTAYVVAGRTREIGLRMALGARGGQVQRLILRQGMSLAGIGLLAGLGVALATTRFLNALLYGTPARDPLTFCSVAMLLALVALLACYLPARRAARVDPMVALRAE